MKCSRLWVALAVAGALVSMQVRASAQDTAQAEQKTEQRILVGTELGGTGAMAPLEQYVDNGAVLSPFAAYMYNDFLGAMCNLHLLAIPNKDSDPNLLEDDVTWAFGMTLGPRIALPLGGFEVWGTWQGGFFSGLAPHSPIDETSWGFSTGGGVNMALTDRISFGLFGRYNRIYDRVYSQADAKYATGGVTFTYKLDMPTFEPGPPPPK